MPKFDIGQPVRPNGLRDRQEGYTKSTGRVVETDAGRADEVHVERVGHTVYEHDGNKQYGPDAPVVRVVFEKYLDMVAEGWREWPPSELPERLDAHLEETGDYIIKYPFPEGRLKAIEN